MKAAMGWAWVVVLAVLALAIQSGYAKADEPVQHGGVMCHYFVGDRPCPII